jgi:hypothetical protein
VTELRFRFVQAMESKDKQVVADAEPKQEQAGA